MSFFPPLFKTLQLIFFPLSHRQAAARCLRNPIDLASSVFICLAVESLKLESVHTAVARCDSSFHRRRRDEV